MTKVIFYEAFEEEAGELKKRLPKGLDAVFTWKTIQEAKDKAAPAEIISIRTQSRIPEEWKGAIKGVLTRSQGYDHVLGFYLESNKNIPCGYLDNYCARAVAEQAVLMMMALLRKLKKQMSNFQSFSRDGMTGLGCEGRKVLVVGVGNIGGEIIDMVKGLKMPVRGVDIKQKRKDVSYVALERGVSWADIIFCALPLTEKTDGMINGDLFKGAEPGKVFINIARGEISPVKDLKRLLDDKILTGIGLDVYPAESTVAARMRAGLRRKTEEEQCIYELSQRENVICTPHNAFNTREALEQKAALTVAAINHFSKHGKFPSAVPSL